MLGVDSKRASIFNDIRLAISSKFVLLILCLSGIFRIVLHIFVLPESPSEFGPDEGTYAALAKYASQGLPMQDFPLYGAGLYNSAKSITLPSAFLVKLGMNELNAVRAVASGYGLASSIVLVLCFLASIRLRNQTFNLSGPALDRKFVTLLLIFTFFPSNFVWSTLGLRESGSQFWLITTFYLILKLLDSAGRDRWKFTALCSLALTLAHGTRPETALVFSLVALLVSIVLLLKYQKFLFVIGIFFGVLGGQAFTATPEVRAEKSLDAYRIIEPKLIQSATPKPVESNQSATPKPVEILEASPEEPASENCTQENELIRFEDDAFRCKSSISYQVTELSPVKTLEKKILTTQILEYKRTVNASDAQSALPTTKCQGLSRDIFLIIECNISELPYRLFAFLFRPLVFFDQGSTTLKFAALENLTWLLLIPLSVWMSLRKVQKSSDRALNLSLISYVILFASAAALYEGNLGTAFRHKSTILWPLIFILMIAPRISSKTRLHTSAVS